MKNRRNAKRWPLLALAGQLEQVTAEQVEALHAAGVCAVEQHIQHWLERQATAHAELSQYITADELMALDEKRKMYPTDGAYGCDLYHAALKVVLFFGMFA